MNARPPEPSRGPGSTTGASLGATPEPGAAGIDLPPLIMRMSLLTDLARDVPYETALLASYISMDLADAIGLAPADRRAVFYASLLRYLGCTAFAPELSAAFELDERSLHAHFATVDVADREMMRKAIVEARPRLPLEQIAGVLQEGVAMSQCEVAQRSARRLGLDGVRCGGAVGLADGSADGLIVRVLGEIFERWDGRGVPRRLRGAELALPTRVLHIGYVAALSLRALGAAATAQLLVARAGTWLDPDLVAAAVPRLRELAESCHQRSIWDAYAAIAPSELQAPAVLDELVSLLGEVADLKSVHRLGHSVGVAELAAAAAGWLGLDAAAQREVRLAGHVHDLGIVAVATQVLDRPARLTPSEFERVRLHAYYTRRVLSDIPELERVGAIAGAHHERLDASGYPAGAGSSQLSMQARLLAACDVARALREARPHRPAYEASAAAEILRAEVAGGRLDGGAVEAVLAVSGGGGATSSRGSALFTPRQIEVLRLLSLGFTEKEIAADLGLSPRTVHHHVTAIYERAGVSSRAAVALFAVEHGLLLT